MEYKLYLKITCPTPTESATENIENVFITMKCTQCKTSYTLKSDVFELPDNKNIGKLSLKYELFYLD